jgi:NADH-quinone oxidoreductase subunit N
VELENYAGLGYRFPVLAACLTIFLLSLIGIPLTGGFLGKFYAFRASLRADLVWLTILAVLNSAIASYYYLRVIVAMYMQTPIREVPCERLSPATRGVLILCTVATFLLGVFPQSVLRLALRAARWFPEG